MSDLRTLGVLCITSRGLCCENFLTRIETIAKARPAGIVLREKDLVAGEYETLAASCQEICAGLGVDLVAHTHIGAAKRLGISAIHLSFQDLVNHAKLLAGFAKVGASVHTLEEAARAQAHGATYLIAGHIFPTDSKKGVPPRGLEFLESICRAVCIPVFAIGGITPDRMPEIRRTDAAGVCVMSGLMTCGDPAQMIAELSRGP
jgi:thiamine-phosphate pyrophosphorylase